MGNTLLPFPDRLDSPHPPLKTLGGLVVASLVERLWLAHGSLLCGCKLLSYRACCNPEKAQGFLCSMYATPTPRVATPTPIRLFCLCFKPKHECNMLPGFVLPATLFPPPSLWLLLSFLFRYFVSSLIETYGNFLALCGNPVLGRAWRLLINKQLLFDFITLSRAFSVYVECEERGGVRGVAHSQ